MVVLGDGHGGRELGVVNLGDHSSLWAVEGLWTFGNGEGDDGWCAAAADADGGTGCGGE